MSREKQQSKHSKGPDNFLFNIILIAIVVIWLALACGNLLGHYIVKKGFFSKGSYSDSAIKENSSSVPQEIYSPFEIENSPSNVDQSPLSEQTEQAKEESTKAEETNSPKPGETKSSEKVKEVKKIEKTEESAGLYKLQMGAFSDYKNAKELMGELNKLNIKTSVEKVKSDGEFLYKVFAGSVNTRKEAVDKAKLLKAKGLAPIIISTDK